MKPVLRLTPARTVDALVCQLGVRPEITILLDYDGTLVPIVDVPERAAPDEHLLALLGRLDRAPRTSVEIVTGRPLRTVDRWFGHLPVALWAEHGFWHRPRFGTWTPACVVPPDWTTLMVPTLEEFTARTAGSFIETKSASVAWHYRLSEPATGRRNAEEMRRGLAQSLADQPFEVLDGNKVVEVRLRGVSKALAAQRLLNAAVDAAGIVAVGDDDTDEDLFVALPPPSVTIVVGMRASAARYRVADSSAVRTFLTNLADARHQAPA